MLTRAQEQVAREDSPISAASAVGIPEALQGQKYLVAGYAQIFGGA
jgi:hypothetical protein